MFFLKKSFIKKDMPIVPKNLCIIPFIHLTSKPDGRLRLCCFSSKYIKDKKGQYLNLGQHSFQEVWNGEDMRSVRLKMLKGEKLPECQNCWNEEAQKKESKRLRDNNRFLKNYKHHIELSTKNKGYLSEPPIYIDLRLGNKCNLKCRTCNPLFSSSIAKEMNQHSDLLEKTSVFSFPQYQDLLNRDKNQIKWYQTEIFFNTIKTISCKLNLIYISGGEPFLIKELHRFVDYFLKNRNSKKVQFNANSNLTYLDKSLLEKLTKFKRFHLSVSVDACGNKNNYIRSPSQFLKIEKNMEFVLKLPKTVEVSLNCTVSIYNILYIADLMSWLREMAQRLRVIRPVCYFDMVHQPEFQHISILPRALKQKSLVRIKRLLREADLYPSEIRDINYLINLLQASMKDTKRILFLRNEFRKHTKILDQLRNEKFFKVFPEFKGHLR